MILSLATKYRSATAALMASTMYVEMLLPLRSLGAEPRRFISSSPISTANHFSLNSRNNAIGTNAATQHNTLNLAGKNNFGIRSNKSSAKTFTGPGQPEMSSFQSVNANNMVDLFTGDFSYNIPLMDVGGYPLNIHYNSGISMDQEASWVGLGWNLNPGTITRNMRGLPDDFNAADSITKTQSIKSNRTIGVKLGGQAEIVGFPLSGGLGLGVFHNNYNGWGIEQSVNASISMSKKTKGDLTSSDDFSGSTATGSLGIGLNNNSQSGLSVSPSLNVGIKRYEHNDEVSATNYGLSTNYHTRGGLSSLTIDAPVSKLFGPLQRFIPNSVSLNFARPSVVPTITMPTTSHNYVFHAKAGGEAFGLHLNVFVEGYVNEQEIKDADKTQKLPAYGYLYYSAAGNNPRALLDFNREKELQFNYASTPHLAIPQYTYDVYSMSGEGTGGTIRPYRGDVGVINDHYMRTNSSNDQFSVELGFGNVVHTGFSYDFVRSYTENSRWSSQNRMLNNVKFSNSSGLYQSVYFRNPGEKSSNTADYYNSIGDDNLVRVKLDRSHMTNVTAASSFMKYDATGNIIGEMPITAPIQKINRDKRSQVVSFLTAEDAAQWGLDKTIVSYKENSIPIGACTDTLEVIPRVDNTVRKKNHISEIDVLNGDGRKYVYGIPAYNIEESNVSFSSAKEIDPDNLDKGLANYQAGVDNSVKNKQGKENYFSSEKVPAYSHSFLLTAILSPDYIDVKNDGVTDDDFGDAIRFNYSRVYGSQGQYFDWRQPMAQNRANYNEGFKTYSRDDRASYLYGKKEVWYAHSVESKSMIALFKIAADRKDAIAAIDENGGLNPSKPLRRLDRIELYAKSDLIKNGAKALPVKTVHFEYGYDLCKGAAGDPATGKLTLKKIWFSYNGNEKGKQNPYTFNYNGSNSPYHPKKYDRWGNYKDPASNPGGLNNADFPYAVQDSTVAAQNASNWTLTDITLPSGGKISATYESDDYAFVQNRRATAMMTLAGFGKNPTDNPSNHLYDGSSNDLIFVKVAPDVANAQDFAKRYLEGLNYIYLKLAVTMPPDRWGSGFDFVPIYGKIDSYGKAGGANLYWIKLQDVAGKSAIIRSVFQFLKNNLPAKAYPTSEVGDNIGFGDAVKMLLSSMTEIQNAVSGFETASMIKGWCKVADPAKSFIRLDCPNYTKLGGGLRVKKIVISDNWKAMTGQRESLYGQVYQYQTSIMVNGVPKQISSGVASYEPMIGAEENPFREPIDYSERIAPLAPVAYLFSEMPLGESYFPGASVGYSKVRVRTINAKAKSVNGWQETEFFTTKDFPTRVEHSLLDADSKARYKPKLLNFLKVYSVDRITASQGFKVELNDMNGKMKASANYAETDSLHPMSYTLNFYKVDDDRAAKPHLNNTAWVVDSLSGHVNRNGIIGKDVELMSDFRQQYSFSVSGGLSPNLDYFQIGIFPIPLPSFFKFPQFDESQFRSAAMVKVVQRYGILDSVVAMDKGSVVSTKNLLYDGETGAVIVSRTNNEFNDAIYNLNYPAQWAYSGMGPAYKNIDAEFKGLHCIGGKLLNADDTPFDIKRNLESGDELLATGSWNFFSLPVAGDCNFSIFFGTPIPKRAWVINAEKGYQKNKGFFLIDVDGHPLNVGNLTIRVLRSGKRNMLDAGVGSLVSLKNPIREVTTGNYRLVVDSSLQIIQTSANAFKDFRKVENSLYVKDTVIKVFHQFGPITLSPTVTTKRIDIDGTQRVREETNLSNSDYFATSYDYIPSRSCVRSRNLRTKSILVFDSTQIPKGAIINSAYLSLAPRVPTTLWFRKSSGNGNFFCPNTYSYDWSRANNFFLGTSLAYLRRITNPWNAATPFRSVLSTTGNQVAVTSTAYGFIDVRALMQDVVNTNWNGISIEINKNSNTSNNYETNFLSFGGKDAFNVNTAICGGATGKSIISCNTFRPSMQVTYTAEVDTTVQVCRYNINDSMLNPYRWGILGNWSNDRAYTYYNNRVETNAAIPNSDIRREGAIAGFMPFWKFSDSGLVAVQDTNRWVWNSAQSLYNKKGFEIENYDPLGRFNAGAYGFNQTIATATAQNSRYQELLSDGFEDYNYRAKNCLTCPAVREIDFVNGQTGVSVSSNDSHTGLNSLHVDNGRQSKLNVKLSAYNKFLPLDSFYVKIDSVAVINKITVGAGRGLVGNYSGRSANCFGSFFTTRTDPTINFIWGNSPPFTGMCSTQPYSVTWTGKIQATITGSYVFTGSSDNILSMQLSSGAATLFNITKPPPYNGDLNSASVTLNAGQIYDFRMTYTHTPAASPFAFMRLLWSINGGVKTIIPQQFLYPQFVSASDTAGSVISQVKKYCTALQTTKPFRLDQVVKPIFSPMTGKRMLVSAWAKLDGADCSSIPAPDKVVNVSFNNGATYQALLKTGIRIEGWQRYEAVIDVPTNATQMQVMIQGASGMGVYVDDIRVHPYNSNVKSFVYNNTNLRLMAELDENNYASFYEYDDDGTLIRVKKETEKGIQTIKESRSALLKDQ